MIDIGKTAFNVAIDSFQNSPMTLLYHPATFEPLLVVKGEGEGEEVELFATVLSPDQDPAATAQALMRQDGSVSNADQSKVQELINIGAVAISSSSADYFVTAPVEELGFDSRIYIHIKGHGVKILSIASTSPSDIEAADIPDNIANLIAFV